MTKKDYQLIADAINDCASLIAPFENAVNGEKYLAGFDAGTSSARDFVASRLAEALAADNPRFDRKRFMTACGL